MLQLWGRKMSLHVVTNPLLRLLSLLLICQYQMRNPHQIHLEVWKKMTHCVMLLKISILLPQRVYWTPTFLEISLEELTDQNILRSPAQPSFHVTTNITGFIVLVHQPSCLVHDIFTGSGRVFFVSQIWPKNGAGLGKTQRVSC